MRVGNDYFNPQAPLSWNTMVHGRPKKQVKAAYDGAPANVVLLARDSKLGRKKGGFTPPLAKRSLRRLFFGLLLTEAGFNRLPHAGQHLLGRLRVLSRGLKL